MAMVPRWVPLTALGLLVLLAGGMGWFGTRRISDSRSELDPVHGAVEDPESVVAEVHMATSNHARTQRALGYLSCGTVRHTSTSSSMASHIHLATASPLAMPWSRSSPSHYGWRDYGWRGDAVSIFGSSHIWARLSLLRPSSNPVQTALLMPSWAPQVPSPSPTTTSLITMEVMLLGHSDSYARDKAMQSHHCI
ncbi:hypothetical protein J5N97_023125 [Dioscorea zingiberensis]|uniref:Uncharacterized protein n=1 Tax=Dioscorea zingiberensis TaxID=325984 RepID=A0A9D5HBM4_9LILI|nr:hypothetical protein J5N97_023125 [Dioscorea zingiberensis]